MTSITIQNNVGTEPIRPVLMRDPDVSGLGLFLGLFLGLERVRGS